MLYHLRDRFMFAFTPIERCQRSPPPTIRNALFLAAQIYQIGEDTPCQGSLLSLKTQESLVCPPCQSTCHAVDALVGGPGQHSLFSSLPQLGQSKFEQG